MVKTSKRIKVYRNLHRDCFSVVQGSKVIAHVEEIFLRDVRYLVQPAGRAKVLEEQRKNVHAYVTGYVVEESNQSLYDMVSDRLKIDVSYNPYKSGNFTDYNGCSIHRSDYAWLHKNKKIIAIESETT